MCVGGDWEGHGEQGVRGMSKGITEISKAWGKKRKEIH